MKRVDHSGTTAVVSISILRRRLDQAGDLDHRHRREVAAHQLAPGGADLGEAGAIFVACR